MVAVLEIGAFSTSSTTIPSVPALWSFYLMSSRLLHIPAYNRYLRPYSRAVLMFPVTSLLAAPIADNYGRRITLRIGAVIFTIGGAIQTFCNGYGMMVGGRVVSGFGVGMLSMIVPIYQVSLSLLHEV